MSGLPQGWVETTIGEVCEVNPGDSLDVSPDAPVSFVPMQAVSEVTGEIVSARDRPFHEVQKGFTRFKEGDVIFAKITPSMENGKSAVARKLTNGAGLGSTEFHVFRPVGGVESDYVWRFVRQQSFRDGAEAVMSGAVGQQRVPADYLRAHAVPMAPVQEQGRIVAKLDGLLGRTARARKELDRVPKLVAHYKHVVLRAAFSGDLTRDWRGMTSTLRRPVLDRFGVDGRTGELADLPDTWAWTSLRQVATVSGGLTKNAKRDTLPVRVPYLRVANVYANELRLEDVAQIGCTEAELSKTTLRGGDLLIVEGNGSQEQIGRVALWADAIPGCSHQNHIIRARPRPEVTSQFALHWLLSPGGRSAIEQVASSSSGLYTLSISKVEALPIPLCDPIEQHEVVRRIESAFAWLDKLSAEHARAAALLPKLEQTLLAKAFRGELVPQDPNDEPASALLERIRAARAAAPERKRKPRSSDLPRAPRQRAAMTKSRLDQDVMHQPYLAQHLRDAGGSAKVEDLFRSADLPVTDFYKQLAWEVEAGHVNDQGSLLEAA